MSNSRSCYFPNGRAAPYVACDPSASQSACCDEGETCLGNSLCLRDEGIVYRGGCTDQNFKDQACPVHCLTISVKNAEPDSTFSFIKPCSKTVDGSTLWVCGIDGNCSNANATFDMTIGPPTATKITGKIANTKSVSIDPSTLKLSPTATTPTVISATATIISSISISPTSTPPLASSTIFLTATPESPACSTRNVGTVGAATGVPLGIISLIMSLLFLRERWKRKLQSLQMETWKSAAEKPAIDLKTIQGPVQNQVSEVSGGYLGNELENEEPNRAAWRIIRGVNELA